MMIKRMFCVVSLLSCSVAFASTNDVRPMYPGEKGLPVVTELERKTIAAQPAVADLVVFYQPSYARQYGLTEIHRRIEAWVATANESYESHGMEYKLRISDVLPVESVSDNAPYEDVTDENGNIIQDGAEYLFSQAALNPGSPEYEAYQIKWKGDLVVYVREQRSEDSKIGGAGIGGEYSSVLDIGITPETYTTLAHEIGHNIGLNHEEAQANTGPTYARAWVCGGKKTIMYSAATEEETVRHYSSPEKELNGESCGEDNVADNARVLNENFASVAERRGGVFAEDNVYFVNNEVEVVEGEQASFSLQRDGDLTQPASVKIMAKNIEAMAGDDFEDVIAVAQFDSGVDVVEVSLLTFDDEVREGDESFSLSLRYGYKLQVSGPDLAVKIVDNEEVDYGTFSIERQEISVNEGAGSIEVNLSRSGDFSGEVSFRVYTEDGEQKAGQDYHGVDEVLVFGADDSSKSIKIELIDDSRVEESNGTFKLRVEAITPAVSLVTDTVTITIIDNDSSAQTPNTSSGTGSGGGSLGLMWVLLLGLVSIRRFK